MSFRGPDSAMTFRHKEEVEVIKKVREGFAADAYYLRAAFLAAMGGTKCLVQYETRFEEDRTRRKRELLDEECIRPLPPATSPNAHTQYDVYQKVDAYEDGAWWVGRVSRNIDDNLNIYVRLDINGNEICLPFFRLRDHLDWRHGEWVSPPPSRAPRPRSPHADQSY